MHAAPVLAAEERKARAEREMHRAVDFFVIEHVAHGFLDLGIAAHAEFPEHARSGVAVERFDKKFLVRPGGGIDHTPIAKFEPHAFDRRPAVQRRIFAEVMTPRVDSSTGE